MKNLQKTRGTEKKKPMNKERKRKEYEINGKGSKKQARKKERKKERKKAKMH